MCIIDTNNVKRDLMFFRNLVTAKDEHKDSGCWNFWCQLILSLFGITFLFTGIIMADLWPQIFGDIMKNVMLLLISFCILPMHMVC